MTAEAACAAVAWDTNNPKSDSIKRSEIQSEEEIRLSPKFLREVEGAFSFGLEGKSIEPPQEKPDRKQLHQWISEVEGKNQKDLEAEMHDDRSDSAYYATKFDSIYKAAKMWLTEYNPPAKIGQDIQIPGLGNLKEYAPKVAASFDVNILGQYLRPKQVQLRKMRDLADKNRALMDRYYPMEGEVLLDTIR